MSDEQTHSPEPQQVANPLTPTAIFLVVAINEGETHLRKAIDVAANVGDLVRAVGFRSLPDALSCVVGLGSAAWDRIGTGSRPKQLHEFIALEGAVHDAPATPGDLLFHIRADRTDLCFELERLILDKLGDSITVADETQGFRYFDTRDLLGFVDGTENPVGDALVDAVFIGDEDPDFAGGSYAVVQKYTHDLAGWQRLTTEQQELIIGRTKLDDVELEDGVQPPDSHVSLNTITDEDGNDHDILRGNMPFGSPGSGDVGIYYIGFAKDLWVTELMLQNMFVGSPPGQYDRILDFSTAITGTNFFVPSLDLLESLADEAEANEATAEAATSPAPATEDQNAPATPSPGSLGIGSLTGEYGYE